MMKPVNSVEAVLREILRVAPWPYHGGYCPVTVKRIKERGTDERHEANIND